MIWSPDIFTYVDDRFRGLDILVATGRMIGPIGTGDVCSGITNPLKYLWTDLEDPRVRQRPSPETFSRVYRIGKETIPSLDS